MNAPAPSWGLARWIVAVAAAIWLLQTCSTVLLPLCVTIMLLAVTHPLPQHFERWLGRGGRVAGHVLAASVPMLLIGIFAGASVLAANHMPVGPDQLATMVDDVLAGLRRSGLPVGAEGSLAEHVVPMASRVFEQVLAGCMGACLVSLLMMLVWSEAKALPHKLDSLLGPRWGARLQSAWDRYGQALRRFFVVRVITGLLSGVVTTGWLALLGVPEPWLWGLSTFVLNFVPNIGSMLAALPPTLVLYGTEGLQTAFLGAAGLFVIEQVVGNYIDPRLQGRSLQLSSVVILVAIVLLSWLWGPLGALVAVPVLLGCIEVLGLTPAGGEIVPWLRPASVPDGQTGQADVPAAG